MDEPVTESISAPLERATQLLAEYLPNVLAAVVLVVVGWIAAVVLRKLTRYLAARAQQSLDLIPWFQTRTHQVQAYRKAPAVIASVVFWVVLLFFLVAAVEALGPPAVSGLLGRVTTYLPRVLAAVVIALVGLLTADATMHLVSNALSRMGVAYGEVLGRASQVSIITVFGIIAVEQLGIDSSVLILVLSILFGTTLGAAALAFGVGARSVVANMLAVQQISGSYRVGDTVRVGDAEGRIVEITQTAVLMDGPKGRMMIPGQRFTDEISVRVTPDA